jgi:hypothetical protein
LNLLRIAGLTGAGVLLVGAVTVASASCSQTPTNVPVRTFEQAQRVDFVCIAVNDDDGNPLPSSKLQPLPQDNCSLVPVGDNTATFPNHLYAVVTQTTPGTLAAVDLTNTGSPGVVDEDNTTPGINFIPVGAQPTDVVVPPDGSMTFVTSAAPGKPAIYGIDNRHLLGTSTGNPPFPPLTLTDLPACALPQPPLAITTETLPGNKFALVVMLGNAGNAGARIAVYDPGPLLRGAGVPSASASPSTGDAGTTDAGVGDAGAVSVPGELPACTLIGNTLLAGTSSLPSSFQPGPDWADGVPYVDGGVDLEGQAPPPAPVPEGGTGTCSTPPAADAGNALSVMSSTVATPAAMVLRTDNSKLYVADGALPVIHVIDVSDPTNPQEQAPLLATSVRNPSKTITVGPLAISPATRDYQRFLYAVDETEGTVMVYDVTDPVSSPHVPLQRPHAELNPFVEPDRLAFAAPVAAVTFVEHDWLLPSMVATGGYPEHYYSGILCNPNPYAHPSLTDFLAKGAYYRADQASSIQNSGVVEDFPSRLRGVFGFVTLSNGGIIPIDVDDWDAPCRRPDPMSNAQMLNDPTTGGKNPPTYTDTGGLLWGQTGVLDVPQVSGGSTDLGEYDVPLAYQNSISESAAVTEEAFFPVSAPHRIRSGFLLEQDPNGSNNMPHVLVIPQLFDQNGSPVQVGGTATSAPLIQPTQLPPGFFDPSLLTNPAEPDPNSRTPNSSTSGTGSSAVPGIRVSYDDPTAHINQSWTVTFEGPLFSPVGPINLDTTDGYHTLTIDNGVFDSEAGPAPANGLGTPGFCAMGIEDWTIGTARASAAGLAASAAWTADYVEIADNLLAQDDSYWGERDNDCWQGAGSGLQDGASNVADARYSACSSEFGSDGVDAGASGTGTMADQYLSRDFPILQAFDDHLVVGRFGWSQNPSGEQTSNRVIVGSDSSNVPFLKLARCCFHHEVTFKVRTGGEWVTIGQNGLGMLHHVQVGPGGACVLSCNPADVLRNARSLDLSGATSSGGKCYVTSSYASSPAGVTSTTPPKVPFRNEPQAVRNPMFSFYIQPGVGPTGSPASGTSTCNTHTLAARDNQWQFTMAGGFSPIAIQLNGGTNAGVSPQSMKFIEPFGQMAVVDGSQQGLVIIDLNTLGFAHSPYY